MDWKKLIFEDVVGKLVPMGGSGKKLTGKAKVAAILAAIAAAATAASHFIGG